MHKCPVCNSNEIHQVFKDERYKYIMLKCQNCKLLFKTLQGPTNYEKLNIEAYTIYNFSRKREVNDLIKILKRHITVSSKISIVEIGSGTGSLLNEFRNYGINILYGIEPSKIASEYAIKNYDLKIVNNYFSCESFKERCHIILLYDVLEHIQEPNSLIGEISNYMGKETILLIKTGDTNSINARIFPREWIYNKSNQHLCFYNKYSLDKLLNKHHLQTISFNKFKHAYGGVNLLLLARNMVFGLLIRFLFKIKLYVKHDKNYGIGLANDHFIAVIKKK